MPVFPAVASTTRPPGLISPRASASRIIWRPARSFTDWPGFMNSALPRMVQPVSSDARLSLISGVLPMASTIPSRIGMNDTRNDKRKNVMEGARSDKAEHGHAAMLRDREFPFVIDRILCCHRPRKRAIQRLSMADREAIIHLDPPPSQAMTAIRANRSHDSSKPRPHYRPCSRRVNPYP